LTQESQLTNSLEAANALANALLRSGTVSGFTIREMGWSITFSLSKRVSGLVGTNNMILEESCQEEAFASSGSRIFHPSAIRDHFLANTVSEVHIGERSELSLLFTNGGLIRFTTAKPSMDWEWTILPEDEYLRNCLSIVSVQGEEVWTRYPIKLLNWMFDTPIEDQTRGEV